MSAAKGFFGHPAGLSTLFFTELWERFSYYGMRALLILYMTASLADGGLAMDITTAGAIYGLYTSMVYMLSLPGGWIADRFLGQRRAVLYGGIVIALGHFSLALPGMSFFYLGLVLVVVGTGLLKPNISTMVGQLYEPGDQRRDAGFSIFYMGINIGAFIAPLACGYLGQRVDWHLGFGLAGVGMTLGLIQYVAGGRRLGDAGLRPVPPSSPEAGARQRRNLFTGVGVAVLAAAALAFLPLTAIDIANVAGVALMTIVAGFFGWLIFSSGWTPVERKRLMVATLLFVAASVFWCAFEQAGSTMNLFAQHRTETVLFGFDFPASWLQSVNAIFIILLAPVFAWLWVTMGRREPSSPAKFALGLVFLGVGFVILGVGAVRSEAGEMVSPTWLIASFFFHTVGELCLSPVGLSAMTKLAPARVAGMMMGAWFLSNAVGNYVAGRLAGVYEAFSPPTLFNAVAATAIVSGVILALFVRPITRLMSGVK
ncbi:MAG: peptide MFS transporter [Bryobacteraceae bacterium]